MCNAIEVSRKNIKTIQSMNLASILSPAVCVNVRRSRFNFIICPKTRGWEKLHIKLDNLMISVKGMDLNKNLPFGVANRFQIYVNVNVIFSSWLWTSNCFIFCYGWQIGKILF